VAAQIAALRAGAGITACYVNIASREPDLVAVMADTFMFRREMWLVTHPDLRAVRRTRLLFDHLARALTAFAKGHRTKA
jgi:DNA-binding transcriptional LysR family regulator